MKKLSRKYLIGLSLILICIAEVLILQIFNNSSKVIPSQSDSQQIVKKLKQCEYSLNRHTCLKELAQQFLKQYTLEYISKIMKDYEQEVGVFDTCHETSHYLGQIEYQKIKDMKQMFQRCDHFCLDGCFHGAVEGYFISKNVSLDDRNFDAIGGEVGKICGARENYDSQELYITCFHGLGHATMYIADYDIFSALKLCDNALGFEEQELCYTGVYMANADSTGGVEHPSRFIKADDPMYPCTILPQKYQKKCFEYNTINFYHYTNFNWQETIKLCLKVPEAYRWGCFETMGGDQVGFTDEVTKIYQACNEISEDQFKQACFRGAEGNLMMRYTKDFARPITFCEGLESAFQKDCFVTLAQALNRWTKNLQQKQTVCERVKDSSYQALCLTTIKE